MKQSKCKISTTYRHKSFRVDLYCGMTDRVLYDSAGSTYFDKIHALFAVKISTLHFGKFHKDKHEASVNDW